MCVSMHIKDCNYPDTDLLEAIESNLIGEIGIRRYSQVWTAFIAIAILRLHNHSCFLLVLHLTNSLLNARDKA